MILGQALIIVFKFDNVKLRKPDTMVGLFSI